MDQIRSVSHGSDKVRASGSPVGCSATSSTIA